MSETGQGLETVRLGRLRTRWGDSDWQIAEGPDYKEIVEVDGKYTYDVRRFREVPEGQREAEMVERGARALEQSYGDFEDDARAVLVAAGVLASDTDLHERDGLTDDEPRRSRRG